MSIEKIINEAWEIRDKIKPDTDQNLNQSVKEMIDGLNEGKISIAEKQGNEWKVNGWVQKGILLSFRINKRKIISGPYNAWNDFEHLPW